MSKGLFKVEISPNGKTYKGGSFCKSIINEMTKEQFVKCFGTEEYYEKCFHNNFKIWKIVICNVVKIGDYDTYILKHNNKLFIVIDKFNEIYWNYEIDFYKNKLEKKYSRAEKIGYEFTAEESELLNIIKNASHIADIGNDVKYKFNKIRIDKKKL